MAFVSTSQWITVQIILSHIIVVSAKCDADSFCQGKQGLFAAPAASPGNKDCRGWYHCFHGNEPIQLCPSGQRFNQALSNCDWASNVECNPVPTTTSTTMTVTTDAGPGGDSPYMFLGYFSNWYQWWPEPYKFLPSNIQADKITHINFAFAMIGSKDYVVDGRAAPFEIRYFEDNDVSNNGAPNAGWDQPCGNQCSGCVRGLYEQVNDLKEAFPHLKTLISIGGWGFNTAPADDVKNAERLQRLDAGWNEFVFSDMVSSSAYRALFIRSALKFCRTWGFDGLDLDWEYPGYIGRGGRPSDKANFAILLMELRTAITTEALESGRPALLLTAAVGVGPKTASDAYDVIALDENLDFINLMTYDMYGGWSAKTGIHSQLHAGPGDEFPGVNPGDKVPLSGSWAVDWWISQGARAQKLNLGLATYSRSFTLASSQAGQGPGVTAVGTGAAQPISGTPGTAAYYEMVDLIANGATHTFDSQRCGAYLQKGTLWMGFDDRETMMCKAQYIKDKGLLGGFLWDLPEDDFVQDSPLIASFSDALFSSTSLSTTITTSPLPISTVMITATTTKPTTYTSTTRTTSDLLATTGTRAFTMSTTTTTTTKIPSSTFTITSTGMSSCVDATLSLAWSGGGVHTCLTYEQLGGLAYCSHAELQTSCCFCGGGQPGPAPVSTSSVQVTSTTRVAPHTSSVQKSSTTATSTTMNEVDTSTPTTTRTGMSSCVDTPLPPAWSGDGTHTCLTYERLGGSAYCNHIELQIACCYCGGGHMEPTPFSTSSSQMESTTTITQGSTLTASTSATTTATVSTCSDGVLPGSWSHGGVYACLYYEQHGGLAYCAHQGIAETCCFCETSRRLQALSKGTQFPGHSFETIVYTRDTIFV